MDVESEHIDEFQTSEPIQREKVIVQHKDHEELINSAPSSPSEQHITSDPGSSAEVCLHSWCYDEPHQFSYLDDPPWTETSEPGDGQEASTGACQSSGDQGTIAFSALASPSQGKRKQGPNSDKDGSQDEEDNEGFKRPRINVPSPATGIPSSMKFACPYQKSDPEACRSCGQPRTRNRQEPGFRDFHRVV